MYRKNTQSFDITKTCLKKNIASTHPDALGVDTCDQKRHTRHPVKLNYMRGRRESMQRTDASVVDNALKLQGIVHAAVDKTSLAVRKDTQECKYSDLDDG